MNHSNSDDTLHSTVDFKEEKSGKEEKGKGTRHLLKGSRRNRSQSKKGKKKSETKLLATQDDCPDTSE